MSDNAKALLLEFQRGQREALISLAEWCEDMSEGWGSENEMARTCSAIYRRVANVSRCRAEEE